MIDEFPILGRLDVLASSLAYLAGYRVRVALICQGLSQIDDIYGKDGRNSLLQNSAVQLFFATNDETTANYLSARLGKRTVQTMTRSRMQGLGAGSRSYSYTQRDFYQPEEVRRIDPRRMLVLKEGARPVLAYKIRYYKDRAFRRRLRPAIPVPQLVLNPGPSRSSRSVGSELPSAARDELDARVREQLAPLLDVSV
jgi:type IV secretion system protein VirD4